MTYIEEVLDVVVGEALVCEGEPEGVSDQYAVAMEKEGTHLLEAVVHVLLFIVENILCD